MDQYPFFTDRRDAGKKLAPKFNYLDAHRLLVLTILNGGLPVGIEIAKALKCSLSVSLVHKLYPPQHPEVSLGALSLDGTINLNHASIQNLNLSDREVEEIIQATFNQIRAKSERFSRHKRPENLMLKTVVLVDDGLTSGYTMLSAIRAAKKQMPKKVFVAIPTASDYGIELIRNEVDEVVPLYTHPRQHLFKVSGSYQNWHTVTDSEAEKMYVDFLGE